jgi:hypothetical protein
VRLSIGLSVGVDILPAGTSPKLKKITIDFRKKLMKNEKM